MRLRVIVAIWGLSVAWTVSASAADLAPLELVADVPLSGAAVRFDYQSLDVASNRLYIAHMDADQLVVFDTKTRSVVATLAGFPPRSWRHSRAGAEQGLRFGNRGPQGLRRRCGDVEDHWQRRADPLSGRIGLCTRSKAGFRLR
jgi:hypothetical protein